METCGRRGTQILRPPVKDRTHHFGQFWILLLFSQYLSRSCVPMETSGRRGTQILHSTVKDRIHHFRHCFYWFWTWFGECLSRSSLHENTFVSLSVPSPVGYPARVSRISSIRTSSSREAIPSLGGAHCLQGYPDFTVYNTTRVYQPNSLSTTTCACTSSENFVVVSSMDLLNPCNMLVEACKFKIKICRTLPSDISGFLSLPSFNLLHHLCPSQFIFRLQSSIHVRTHFVWPKLNIDIKLDILIKFYSCLAKCCSCAPMPNLKKRFH